MDLYQIHAAGTAGWLTFQGLLPLVAPSLSTSLIQETRNATELETYLARSFALLSLTFALLILNTSGLFSTFLSSSPNASNSSSSTPPETPPKHGRTSGLVASTLLAAARCVLYYTTLYNTAFNNGPFYLELFIGAGLAALGGGLLLFGEGAGSDVKGRSHALFDTPEHKAEVKERHRAKKEG